MIIPILALTLAWQQLDVKPAPVPAPDTVLVTVNGHPIKASAVAPLIWDWYSAQVSDSLARFEVVKEEADKKGVKLTQDEVDQRMAAALNQSQAQSRSADRATTLKALRNQGYPASRLDMAIRIQLMIEHLADVEFDPKDYVRVGTLVITPKSSSFDDKRAAMNSASAASAELASGQKWEAVLAKYSSNPKGTAVAGDIRWVPLAAFPADSRADIAKLTVNQYSKPIETPSGYQIFRIETLGKSATPDDVKEIKTRYMDNARRELFTNLMKSAQINPPLSQ